MRRSVSMLSILLAFMVSLAMGVSTASAGKDCTERLEQGPGGYECTGVDEFGNPVGFFLDIGSISGPDFEAAVVLDFFDVVFLDCACRSRIRDNGSNTFEVLKSFECVSNGQFGNSVQGAFDFNGPSAYQGTVARKGVSIGGGQGVDQEGDSIRFRCKGVEP
jgi:hypothetical protein